MNYELIGGSFPVVVCHLQAGETMVTEGGSMVWMDPCMEMKTSGGGLGRMFSRAFTGENMFQNFYTARSDGKVAFGSSFPGKIIAVDLELGKELIVQKSAFLASESQVKTELFFRKKLSTGLFGGEGFIMQKISGNGTVFLEIDGDFVEYELASGQELIVDTGYVAGFESSVTMDIQTVAGVKNKLFGGEGFFNTRLTGPGKVWLQTMPIYNVAGAIAPYIPTSD